MPRQSYRSDSSIVMNEFTREVIALIKAIPRGRVATYGQIARLAGKPQGSRGVGWILHSCTKSHLLPWQRVINSQGRISFASVTKEFRDQRRLLRKEGVDVEDSGRISLEMYAWAKKPKKRAAPRGDGPRIFR